MKYKYVALFTIVTALSRIHLSSKVKNKSYKLLRYYIYMISVDVHFCETVFYALKNQYFNKKYILIREKKCGSYYYSFFAQYA
jgi:hypothetical protein